MAKQTDLFISDTQETHHKQKREKQQDAGFVSKALRGCFAKDRTYGHCR